MGIVRALGFPDLWQSARKWHDAPLMSNSNPYEAPGTVVADAPRETPPDSSRLQRVKTGRRLLIASIFGFIAYTLLRGPGSGGIEFIVGLPTLIAAITGIVKICLATELGLGVTVMAVIGFFIPFVNIGVYIALIVRATRELRSPSRTPWYQLKLQSGPPKWPCSIAYRPIDGR